jgi:transcriptional regulator with XRE-family HTH domain
MASGRLTLSDQLRRAVDDSGLTRYRICAEIGIAQSVMSRFMAGKGGLSLATIDRLADLLGLNITSAKRRNKRQEG